MLPWQDRVVEEHEALVGKIERLEDFMSSETFVALDVINQGLLNEQLDYMNRYAHVLLERIKLFNL